MQKKIKIIPVRDTLFDIFQDIVVSKCSANSVAWGIPASVIANVVTAQTPWTLTWADAKDKGTRTRRQVIAKQDARKKYEKVLRPFIQQWIQYNSAISNSERAGMGIKSRSTSRSEIPVPTSIPVITIKPGNANSLKVFYKQEPDEAGVSKRAKPDGVHTCEVVYKMGGAAPAGPAECPNSVRFSKSPAVITFNVSDAGKKVYVFARWLNTTNEPGMWPSMMLTSVVPA